MDFARKKLQVKRSNISGLVNDVFWRDTKNLPDSHIFNQVFLYAVWLKLNNTDCVAIVFSIFFLPTAVARVTHTALQAITHRHVCWYSDRQLSCLTFRSTFSGVGAFHFSAAATVGLRKKITKQVSEYLSAINSTM